MRLASLFVRLLRSLGRAKRNVVARAWMSRAMHSWSEMYLFETAGEPISSEIVDHIPSKGSYASSQSLLVTRFHSCVLLGLNIGLLSHVLRQGERPFFFLFV